MRNKGQCQTGVHVHDLLVGYANRVLLGPVNFHFATGLVYGLFGPNGSGKTSLLKAIMGISAKISGKCELCFPNEVIRMSTFAIRGLVIYLPQKRNCFLDLLSCDNMAIISNKTWRGARQYLSNVWLDSVDLIDKWKERRPRNLSGGERQLLSVAAYLASGATVLLLDEPAEGLAWMHRKRLYEVLKSIAHTENRIIIVVDHNPLLLEMHVDRLIDIETFSN